MYEMGTGLEFCYNILVVKKFISKIPKIPQIYFSKVFLVLLIVIIGAAYYFWQLNLNVSSLSKTKITLEEQLASVKTELQILKNQDQYKRNEDLQKEIEEIKKTYKNSILAYETIVDLNDAKVKTDKFSTDFAKILKLLSDQNYVSAQASLVVLNKDLDTEKTKLTSSSKIPENVVVNNTPPASGYGRQVVSTDVGSFTVDIVSANLNSTRVIVDTASDSDCTNNCPVLSLADYVKRSGAYVGINGSFFCPVTYPSCIGKTNSFDTLLMNKNKKYFNSDNNVYSTVPAVIFGGNWARFVSRSLDWGRDTGVDAVIANFPLLLLGGNSQFGGSDDAKINGKGLRNFIGTNGGTVYIGVIYNATTVDEVEVLKKLGLKGALGLDQGGSSALWYGGYKVGPGRNIPNAILFLKR